MNHQSRPRSVVVFVSSLGSGGAERVAVRVCGWLRDAGHNVCLLTLSPVDSDFYPCPHGVRRVGLDLQRPSQDLSAAALANLRRLVALRREVQAHGADVVVSLGDRSNVLMLFATLGLGCRKIISERSDPVLAPVSLGWSVLRRLTYPWATLHVSQSNYVSGWLKSRFPDLPCRVIGNAFGLVRRPQLGTAARASRPVRLVALGRLSRAKGNDILLEAYARAVRESRVPLELRIVGDGEDRDALLTQAALLELGTSVTFSGRAHDVEGILASADIYVLPSRWEGFPNSLVEAMAAGLPVIAARCRGGVEDILGDEPDHHGLEFPPGDVGALAECMVRLVSDELLRKRMAERAKKRAADYHPRRIAAAWLAAVEQA